MDLEQRNTQTVPNISVFLNQKADLEVIFGEDNKQIIEALWWVLNDAVCCFEPKGWDE